MKRGIILNNAYSGGNSSLNQSKRLKEEFEKLGTEITVENNCGLKIYTDGDGNIVNGFKNYDFCVYLDKDKYVSRLLEKSGMRLFNTHAAIRACDDKMNTHILLSENGIPMPATVPGLLCYNPDNKLNVSALEKVGETLGYPVIVKECYGSLGKGVYKADDRKQLFKIAENLKCVPHLFQKCEKQSLGKDLRVIAIGGKPVAAMKRTSENDFRSNLELGGNGEPAEITEEIIKICSKVAEILNLDYCGIDLLFCESGFKVCEVNSNAFFGGIEKVTGINVARTYAEYISSKV